MADVAGSLKCPKCNENYTTDTNPQNKCPTIICKNGHTLCLTCAQGLDKCPTCNEPKALVPNQLVIKLVADRQLQNTGVPEISADHVKKAPQPFSDGACADVYDAEWQGQSVALKVLRRHIAQATKLEDLLNEARLAMLLNHPNVVRIFGFVSIDGSKGMLMEKADRGSLRSALNAANSSTNQLVSISIDIVDGLEHIHSKQMIHRDLKPENVLLFDVKSQLTAKIADFGTSKVIQTSLAGTAMIGTPYYMAPELYTAAVKYGCEVDVYSVAIVLYEVFSGRNMRDAFAGSVNMMQILMFVTSGKRPEIPESFPAELRTVVERGWSGDANVRPTLADFREALCKLKERSTRDANPTKIPKDDVIPGTSGDACSIAGSGANAMVDTYAAFEEQLHKLEQLTNAYQLKDARTQVETCERLWLQLDNRRTATASTVQFHSLKGYVLHWFGESSVAYTETYEALTDLYELCLLGTRVGGEQIVATLRYAIAVFWSQDQYKAATLLLHYAVGYTKSTLSAVAYADVLECFGYFSINKNDWRKILEFVLSTRLKAAKDKSHLNVAIAHYYLAQELFREMRISNVNHSAALDHLDNALRAISAVDADNIWAALCKSLKAEILSIKADDQVKLEEAKKFSEEALEIARRILGKKNQTMSDIYLRLALILTQLQQFDNAETMFKKAIKAVVSSLGPNSTINAYALESLANIYTFHLQKYQEAEEMYFESIQIQKSIRGPGYLELSRLYDRLAETYKKWGIPGKDVKVAIYTRLKSEVESGRKENKFEQISASLNKLSNEVSKTLDGRNQVIEAPGELFHVLRNFFNVAAQPASATLTLINSAH